MNTHTHTRKLPSRKPSWSKRNSISTNIHVTDTNTKTNMTMVSRPNSISTRIHEHTHAYIHTQIAIDKLRRSVEDAKIALSSNSETVIKVNNFFGGKNLVRPLTKKEV